MYKIIICDSSMNFICYIKELFNSLGLTDGVAEFREFYSEVDLLKEVQMDADLIILETHGEHIDGIKVARKLRNEGFDSLIVFCSSSNKLTPSLFKVTPYRYLLKYHTYEKMLTEIKEIVRKLKSLKLKSAITGKHRYNTVNIKPEKILYICIAKRGCNVFLHPNLVKFEYERCLSNEKKINELDDILKPYGFSRIHNSYVVNLKHILSYNLQVLELVDGTVLPISRSKEKAFRNDIRNYFTMEYEITNSKLGQI